MCVPHRTTNVSACTAMQARSCATSLEIFPDMVPYGTIQVGLPMCYHWNKYRKSTATHKIVVKEIHLWCKANNGQHLSCLPQAYTTMTWELPLLDIFWLDLMRKSMKERKPMSTNLRHFFVLPLHLLDILNRFSVDSISLISNNVLRLCKSKKYV